VQRIESTQRSAPNGIQVYILRTMRVRFPHIFESDWEFGFVGSPKFWAPNDAEGFCHHIKKEAITEMLIAREGAD